MRKVATADSETKTSDEPPDHLPTGVELPGGRVLTYPPERDCSCYDCVRAFEAHRDGTLRMPKDGGLPW